MISCIQVFPLLALQKKMPNGKRITWFNCMQKQQFWHSVKDVWTKCMFKVNNRDNRMTALDIFQLPLLLALDKYFCAERVPLTSSTREWLNFRTVSLIATFLKLLSNFASETYTTFSLYYKLTWNKFNLDFFFIWNGQCGQSQSMISAFEISFWYCFVSF